MLHALFDNKFEKIFYKRTIHIEERDSAASNKKRDNTINNKDYRNTREQARARKVFSYRSYFVAYFFAFTSLNIDKAI